MAIGLACGVCNSALADEPYPLGTFPYAPPAGQVRVVTWNIEFLGARHRSAQQISDIAERIGGWDAAVLALQEISSNDTLGTIRDQLGPSWEVLQASGENALLYDTSKVDLLGGGQLSSLANGTGYPGASHRKPVTGVFCPPGQSDLAFRVIGVHCHWSSVGTREAEGAWLREKTLEYLADPQETHEILVAGDYNGVPPLPPHPQLLDGGHLERQPYENSPWSYSGGSAIDHISVTAAARPKVPKGTVFVIRPEHYGETWDEFKATYSDHFPVFADYDVPEPAAAGLLLVGLPLLLRRRRAT